MHKSGILEFRKAYRDGLEGHLKRRPKGRVTSRAARKLGREAVQGGLDLQSLIHIHYEAAQVLNYRDNPCEKDQSSNIAEDIFLAEALQPIEQGILAGKKQLQLDLKIVQRELMQQASTHNKLIKEFQHQEEQARALACQLLQVQEEERKEISRDLHDEIAQVLAGINVRLAALKKISQLERSDVEQRIDQAQALVEKSVAAVHRYALRLRPSLLDDLGLIPSLRSCIKNIIPNRKGLSIRLKTNSNVDFLNNEQRTALYRVAQEALTNVARHAKAKNAMVSVRKLSGRVLLKVHDDGKSFNVNRILNSRIYKRLGLLGMRERIEMLGGIFSIVSTPELGTTITAEIPANSAVSDRLL